MSWEKQIRKKTNDRKDSRRRKVEWRVRRKQRTGEAKG